MVMGCYGGIYEGEKRTSRLLANETRRQTYHTTKRGKTRDTAGDPKHINKNLPHIIASRSHRGVLIRRMRGRHREKGLVGLPLVRREMRRQERAVRQCVLALCIGSLLEQFLGLNCGIIQVSVHFGLHLGKDILGKRLSHPDFPSNPVSVTFLHIVGRDQQTIDDSVNLTNCQIQIGGELRIDSVLFHCHISSTSRPTRYLPTNGPNCNC